MTSRANNKADKRVTFARSFGSFLFAASLLMGIRWLLVEPYVIPSGSMLPTLLINDHIFVNKLAYGVRFPFSKKWIFKFSEPKRGEIVVFRKMGDDHFFMIKRVVAVAGDRLKFSEDGELSINGKPVPKELIAFENEDADNFDFYPVSQSDIGAYFEDLDLYKESQGKKSYRTILVRGRSHYEQEEIVIPPGHIFMMGDNRDNSMDSRAWGPLPVENILGRATIAWLSCEDTLDFAPFVCDPTKLRWRRFLHSIR